MTFSYGVSFYPLNVINYNFLASLLIRSFLQHFSLSSLLKFSLYNFCAIVLFITVLVMCALFWFLLHFHTSNQIQIARSVHDSHVNSPAWNVWQEKTNPSPWWKKTCGTSLSTKIQFAHFIVSTHMYARTFGLCISVAHLGQQQNIFEYCDISFHLTFTSFDWTFFLPNG